MYYAIDFDSRSVESKSEKGDDLSKYIKDNDLSLAVALVDSEDELCLQFSVDEMIDLHTNLTGEDEDFDSDDNLAASACWDALEENKESFPDFTHKLGKKLLEKGAKSKSSKQTKPSNKKAKSSENQAPRTRIKLNPEDVVTIIEGKCKSGSILHTIVVAVEDELCETVSEVLDYIVTNHTIPKTGELADMKFAEHNVKYFIKQGKIAVEEGL